MKYIDIINDLSEYNYIYYIDGICYKFNECTYGDEYTNVLTTYCGIKFHSFKKAQIIRYFLLGKRLYKRTYIASLIEYDNESNTSVILEEGNSDAPTLLVLDVKLYKKRYETIKDILK